MQDGRSCGYLPGRNWLSPESCPHHPGPTIWQALCQRWRHSSEQSRQNSESLWPYLLTGGGGDVSQVRHSLQTQLRCLQLACPGFSPASLPVPSHSFVASSSHLQPSEKSPQATLISPLFSFCSVCSSHTDFVTCFLLLSLYMCCSLRQECFSLWLVPLFPSGPFPKATFSGPLLVKMAHSQFICSSLALSFSLPPNVS